MEVELIGADDMLEAKGFDIKEAVMYQDNLSALIINNNGRLSSVNRIKHIHVRYLLIKDRMSMGDLKVKY